MKRSLAILAIPSLLLSSACADRNDPTVPTTPDRPARLTYAYARIEGSIIIREEPYTGNFLVTCHDNTIAGIADRGTYSLILKLEIVAGDTGVGCTFDVGQPVQATHNFEAKLADRIDSLQTQKVDVIVLPDAPPLARMELPIKSVSAAAGHTCAVSATNTVYCWGMNKGAELGFGSHLQTLHPARVVWDKTAVQVAASGYVQTLYGTYFRSPQSCALREDGTVYCWGDAMLSSFDTTVTSKEAQFPQPVPKLPAFTRIEGGARRPCGITASEELYCWGGGDYYQDVAPGRIALAGVVDVASGEVHRCALTRDGKTHCWGYNEWGEFGDTTTALSFKRIAAGAKFTCALDQEGRAYCWGRNNVGQLGRAGTTTECHWGGETHMCNGTDVSPKPVATDLRFTDIDAGSSHVCALAVDGRLYCWGEGANGQLGNDGFNYQTVPVTVLLSLGLRFAQFSVGDRHACGIATDGKLYCWGQGEFGQLGAGTKADHSRPIAVWGQ